MTQEWVESRKVVCIDWNGVLDTYVGWVRPGFTYPPRNGALSFLKELKDRGYEIVIFTSADKQLVEEWLMAHHMADLVREVTNVKVPALVYLDDRAVQFNGNFLDACDDILNFKTFWETPEHHEGGKL